MLFAILSLTIRLRTFFNAFVILSLGKVVSNMSKFTPFLRVFVWVDFFFSSTLFFLCSHLFMQFSWLSFYTSQPFTVCCCGYCSFLPFFLLVYVFMTMSICMQIYICQSLCVARISKETSNVSVPCVYFFTFIFGKFVQNSRCLSVNWSYTQGILILLPYIDVNHFMLYNCMKSE